MFCLSLLFVRWTLVITYAAQRKNELKLNRREQLVLIQIESRLIDCFTSKTDNTSRLHLERTITDFLVNSLKKEKNKIFLEYSGRFRLKTIDIK